MKTDITDQSYEMRARYFYIAVLAVFVYRFISNVWFSELVTPVLVNPSIDNFYWVFQIVGLHKVFTQSVFLPAIGDISIGVVTLICVFSPASRWIWAILFTVLFTIYYITINTFSCHHYHGLAGILLLSVTFWSKDKTRFVLLWEAARYYFLFSFLSAAIWKISRGSVFVNDQLANILKAEHAQYLFAHADSMQASVYRYLITHTGLSHLLLIKIVLLQLLFAIGFFTKKYDWMLLLIAVLFCVLNYFSMRIVSFEWLLMGMTLIDWESLAGRRDSATV